MYNYIAACIIAALLTGKLVAAEDDAVDSTFQEPVPMTPESAELDPVTEKLASLMDDFHVTADLIDRRVDARLSDDSQKTEPIELYQKMTECLDDIIDLLVDTVNAEYFLSAHGFDTIVAPNLPIKNAPLRTRLLLLTKALFTVAPASTKATIPSRILDDVLDIFENDEDVSLKALAIEVLSVWLPNNPSSQARVMKMKGLEPFYEQFSKLEKPMIGSILQLFAKIINEHEEARTKKSRKSKVDFVSQKLYQQIGLIERLSTPLVCNGLSNVFKELWAVSKADKEVLPPVLDLMRLIKPYCTAVYRGRGDVKALLKQMLRFVEKPRSKESLETINTSVPELTAFLEDFIKEINVPQKEEL